MIQRLTDATFERTIRQARSPILVTFSAPVRCGACREQKPALEMLSQDGYPIYYVDVEQPDTAYVEKTFGGRGVPFHKIYAAGRLLLEHVGVLDGAGLLNLLAEGNQRMRKPERGGYASVGGFLGGFGRSGGLS
jgi:hypothetical protein